MVQIQTHQEYFQSDMPFNIWKKANEIRYYVTRWMADG